MEYEVARQRNLKVKLFHKYLLELEKGNENFKTDSYTLEQISNELFFKKKDITIHLKDLFVLNPQDDKYLIKNEVIQEIERWYVQYSEYSPEKNVEEAKLEAVYVAMTKAFSDFNTIHNIADKINEAAEVAVKLHFIYLPLFDERTMINRDVLPEEDPEKYYRHFHTIEDLYEVITKKNTLKWNSKDGDENLNKAMEMRIYSNRWGHEDIYIVERLENGWNFKHLMFDENSSKDGTVDGSYKEGFFKILNHDSIHFPFEVIKRALEQLWESADSRKMSVEEVQERLQDIGTWIGNFEREFKRGMPDWFNY